MNYDNNGMGGASTTPSPSNLIKNRLEIHNGSVVSTPAAGREAYRPWDGEPYLRGPIPWLWLRSVEHICGGCLYVAIGLWHWRAVTKSTTFDINQGKLADFLGKSRRTIQRHMRVLEDGGFIDIERPAGCKIVVTLHENLGEVR